MEITSLKGADPDKVADAIKSKLNRLGITGSVSIPSRSAVHIGDIRLQQPKNVHMVMYLSGYTKSPKLTHVLGWDDWVHVNNAINDVIDSFRASANIKSLGGKFRIRTGTKKFTEEDWDALRYENVGSMVHPVTREEAILPITRAKDLGYLSEVQLKSKLRRLSRVV